jgi:hypothetical protein
MKGLNSGHVSDRRLFATSSSNLCLMPKLNLYQKYVNAFKLRKYARATAINAPNAINTPSYSPLKTFLLQPLPKRNNLLINP